MSYIIIMVYRGTSAKTPLVLTPFGSRWEKKPKEPRVLDSPRACKRKMCPGRKFARRASEEAGAAPASACSTAVAPAAAAATGEYTIICH